jgi:hypothetical protein
MWAHSCLADGMTEVNQETGCSVVGLWIQSGKVDLKQNSSNNIIIMNFAYHL